MQHPEEGIIHAWIDGALPPAEASALEAHVASCAECAARVAEARGLVAAASRIVRHLDAVPGNVLPAKPIRRRSWTRSAWPVAIAATLVLGISLYTREKQQPLSNAAVPALADSSLLVAANTREVAADAPPKARTVQPPRQVTAGQGPVTQKSGRVSQRAGVTSDMQASAAAASAPPPSAPAPVAPQMAVASAPVPTPVTPTERAAETRGEPVALSRSAIAVGGSAAGAAAPARAQRAARTELLMEARQRDAGNFDAAVAFAGCYDLGVSTDILPARFALTSDTSGAMPGLLAIRYLDGSGRPSDRVADAGWVIEGGRAVVKTLGRGLILSLAKTGSEVVADSPNGPRTGRVASCK